MGLQQYIGIECLFYNKYLLLFYYVDDIVLMYKEEDANKIDKFQQKLFSKFKMRCMGELEWFLGI
jgi:hypothetical protein